MLIWFIKNTITSLTSTARISQALNTIFLRNPFQTPKQHKIFQPYSVNERGGKKLSYGFFNTTQTDYPTPFA